MDKDDEIEMLRQVCGEAYQVVGNLAFTAGCFDSDGVTKALDNLVAASNGEQPPHDDVLPFFAKVSLRLHIWRINHGGAVLCAVADNEEEARREGRKALVSRYGAERLETICKTIDEAPEKVVDLPCAEIFAMRKNL